MDGSTKLFWWSGPIWMNNSRILTMYFLLHDLNNNPLWHLAFFHSTSVDRWIRCEQIIVGESVCTRPFDQIWRLCSANVSDDSFVCAGRKIKTPIPFNCSSISGLCGQRSRDFKFNTKRTTLSLRRRVFKIFNLLKRRVKLWLHKKCTNIEIGRLSLISTKTRIYSGCLVQWWAQNSSPSLDCYLQRDFPGKTFS